MLEPILQGLREVDGVQGAIVIDPTGSVVAHRAHAIYDLPMLQEVARAVVNAVDSVQLIQDDWEVLTAQFGDGKVLLRSLRIGGTKPRRFVLAVIADATLNIAFLGVALRVAAGKLVSEIESNPTQGPGTAVGSGLRTSQAIPVQNTGRIPVMDSRTDLARSGLSWSGVGASSNVSAGSGVGGLGASDVSVMDTASSTFLSACTKALAASVGPMAKVLVKEAVRKVCGGRPFSREDGPELLALLSAGIDDSDDRVSFQRATRAL